MRILLTSLLLTLSLGVYAKDMSFVQKKDAHVIKAGMTFSVLEIADKKITNVDVDADLCEIEPTRSRKLGKLVFKPLTEKEFTVFITDADGVTHSVKVVPDKNMESTLYQLKIKNIPLVSDKVALGLRDVSAPIKINQPREKLVANLIKSAIEGNVNSNVVVRKFMEEIYLWEESRFVKVQEFDLNNLVVTKYVLQNISDAPLVMTEKEFYTVDKEVVAVAIEKHSLNPLEVTNVFVARKVGY